MTSTSSASTASRASVVARPWSRSRSRSSRRPSFARANAGVDIPTLLNNTPHARETRAWFYDDCAKSIAAAVTSKERRIKIKTEFPELNVSGDVYRVGTTLELVRRVATTLARDGMRVKVCAAKHGERVFQALPLSLSGVSKLLELMDWDGDVADIIVQRRHQRRGWLGRGRVHLGTTAKHRRVLDFTVHRGDGGGGGG